MKHWARIQECGIWEPGEIGKPKEMDERLNNIFYIVVELVGKKCWSLGLIGSVGKTSFWLRMLKGYSRREGRQEVQHSMHR